MSQQPIIYILDLDGTIIGDISPQVMVYDIFQEIKTADPKVSINLRDLHYNLKAGIIRPSFLDFVNHIKRFQPNAEFYIYTASQPKWADFIVKNIERALKIKFNRPIFTRKDCISINGEISKSLYKIKSKLKASLKRKYPNTDLNQLLTVDNILIVDNNRVFPNSFDNKRLVHCSTYMYRVPENIPAIFGPHIFNKHSHAFYTVFSRYQYHIPVTTSYLKFQRIFYQSYMKELDRLDRPHDKFWETLKDVIIKKGINSFSENSVKFINSRLHSSS